MCGQLDFRSTNNYLASLSNKERLRLFANQAGRNGPKRGAKKCVRDIKLRWFVKKKSQFLVVFFQVIEKKEGNFYLDGESTAPLFF